MTTLRNEIINQNCNFRFIHQKAEECCRLFEEEQPNEAEIALSEALQYSQGLIEEHPDDRSLQIFLAETHHIIALAYSHIELYGKAKEHLAQAHTIYQKIKGIGREYEPVISSSLARIEYKEGNDDKAVEILEKTLQNIDNKSYEEITEDSYVYCSNLILTAMIRFNSGQYQQAVETTRRAITLKKTDENCTLNILPKEFIELLNVAAFQSAEQKDHEFHHLVLEEGIEACQQAERDGIPINPLSLASFYQDLIRMLFFEDKKEELCSAYEALIAYCDKHVGESPELMKYKISGQLNYAVYCSKSGDLETAEKSVNEAISGCSEINDDEGPEQTLFMVSALNILANIQWERGECQGALSDLSSEYKILSDYLETHSDLSPSLLPLCLELVINQVMLLQEAGKHEQGEALLENIKSEYRPLEEESATLEAIHYVVTLKKIADLHRSWAQYEQAKKEYEEALYRLKVVKSQLPEIAECLQELQDEIIELLTINDL